MSYTSNNVQKSSLNHIWKTQKWDSLLFCRTCRTLSPTQMNWSPSRQTPPEAKKKKDRSWEQTFSHISKSTSCRFTFFWEDLKGLYRCYECHLIAGQPPLTVQLRAQDTEDHHLHGVSYLLSEGYSTTWETYSTWKSKWRPSCMFLDSYPWQSCEETDFPLELSKADGLQCIIYCKGFCKRDKKSLQLHCKEMYAQSSKNQNKNDFNMLKHTSQKEAKCWR